MKASSRDPGAGERDPGMLLLMNQLQGSVECLSLIGHKNMRKKYFCAQSETSFFCRTAFVIFLYDGVYLQTQLFIIIIIIIIIIVISIN